MTCDLAEYHLGYAMILKNTEVVCELLHINARDINSKCFNFYLFSWCGYIKDDGDELESVKDQLLFNETQST